MIRTQVQLTEAQLEALRKLAVQENVSLSEVVRRAVATVVESDPSPSDAELRRRAAAVAGRFASGRHDVARRHDEYLAEALRP